MDRNNLPKTGNEVTDARDGFTPENTQDVQEVQEITLEKAAGISAKEYICMKYTPEQREEIRAAIAAAQLVGGIDYKKIVSLPKIWSEIHKHPKLNPASRSFDINALLQISGIDDLEELRARIRALDEDARNTPPAAPFIESVEQRAAELEKDARCLDVKQVRENADFLSGLQSDSADSKEVARRKAMIREGANKAQNNIAVVENFIMQGRVLNTLTKISPNEWNTETDALTQTATVTRDGISLTFPLAFLHKAMRTSAYQTFDFFLKKYTETKNANVVIPLNEFMAARGLKDRKDTRKRLIEDMNLIYSWELTFSERAKNGRLISSDRGRIISRSGSYHGYFRLTFGPLFLELIEKGFYSPMRISENLFRYNANANPNSYYLMRKIFEHKRMNAGKPNEDVISVQTLLGVCPCIPIYEKVMETDRKIGKRIIEPFERDMDALANDLSWEYCDKGGTHTDKSESAGFKYSDFISSNILITWHNYPDSVRSSIVSGRKDAQKKARTKRPTKRGG